MPFTLQDFIHAWETKRDHKYDIKIAHTPEIWDERAAEWIDEVESDASRKMARVLDNTAFLRSQGLLGGGTSAVDVGCGPGLFPLEFAKTCDFALGLDFSRKFVAYGNDKARRLGINNVRFEYCDFAEDDVSEYVNSFDLAFSSITPAVSTYSRMEKFMTLSRAWCCNVTFVNVKDDLSERISNEVFDEEFTPRRNGYGFYCLLNILWLSGYYPKLHYFDDVRFETIVPSRSEAKYLTENCRHSSDEDIDRVHKWLESHGEMPRNSIVKFGLILWDKRIKDKR